MIMPTGGRVTGEAATRLYKSIMKPVYWHLDYRVVVVGHEWSRDSTIPIRITQPGDIRPALNHDVEVVRGAIEYSIGRKALKNILPSGLIYLNKIQAIDAADEVIAGGLVIGARIYDIYKRRWVFRPSRHIAQLIVDEQLGYHAILRDKAKPGDVLPSSSIKSGELPEDTGLYIAFRAPLNTVGVAKILDRGKLRIIHVWRGQREPLRPMPGADRSKLVEALDAHLDRLERASIRFLEKTKSLGEPLIALSGGKDSTVAASIAVKAGITRGYFFDTGIEFPETIDTAHIVANKLGITLHEISAGNTFWKALDVFGPPARDYRWCCKVVKFGPLAKGLKPLIKDRMVTITGQRAFESTQRAQAGKLSPSASTGRKDLLAAPIQEWTSLEVYAYIWRGKLPLNPVYHLGYERVGCYLCPTSRLAEIENARRFHKDLWSRWDNYLYRYARKHGLPREWVVYGFWRWRFSYPAEVRHLAIKLGLNPGKMLEKIVSIHVGHSIDFTREGECHTFYLNDTSFEPSKVFTLMSTTKIKDKAHMEKDGTIVVIDEESRIILRLRPTGVLEICGKGLQRLRPQKIAAISRRVLAPAYMAGVCGGCGVCVASCPTGALRAPASLNEDACVGCMTCSFVCPSAGKLSHHAVIAVERAIAQWQRNTPKKKTYRYRVNQNRIKRRGNGI